jgi:hypothetical protein
LTFDFGSDFLLEGYDLVESLVEKAEVEDVEEGEDSS